MKKSLYSQIAGVVLCAGVIIFTLVWGCSDVPQEPSQGLALADVKDSLEIEHLYDMAWELLNKNPDSSKTIAEEMIKKSEASGYKIGVGRAYNVFGSIEFAKSNYKETFKYWLQALKIYEECNNSNLVAALQINIGALFSRQKNQEEALKYYFKAKKTIENKHEKDSLSKEQKIRISAVYNNIGMIFADKEDYEKASENYLNALQTAEQVDDDRKVAEVCNNLGNLFRAKTGHSQALTYYQRSLRLYEKLEDKSGVAICFINIGDIMMNEEKFEEAENYFVKSLSLAEEVGDKRVVVEISKALAKLYSTLGNSKSSEYWQKAYDLRDSVLNEESSKQIAQMQVVFETEKKDSEIKLLNKDNEVKESENKKQRIIIYATLGGVVFLLAFAFFVYRFYKKEQKAKILMAKQKQEIEIQKAQIEHQAKEINDNIVYAKRIQNGVMPTLTAFQKRLPNSFILFKPKDNVSGDFYWMETKGEFTFFAAADCTGHGVSGAMVSMVCSSVLNRCVKDFGLVRPGEILNKATELVIEEFQKSESTIQDGMDISLCVLNSETDELLWAGANNPLYLVRDQLIEYKADKQHIGKHDHIKPFTTHRIKLQSGDSFYIFSDGYPTQIGGPEDKKFMSKKFKNLLVSIQERNMEAQKNLLDEAIEEWMKPEPNLAYEQTDDILVIGVRI